MKDKTNPSSKTVRECDIFISYRRDGGDMTAMYFYQALKERGYNVFYDLEVLRAGKFNEALLSSIQSCKDFVLILSPHALDRCNDENDWVRREIAEALRTKKNIVPVMMKGFEFPEKLPDDIDDVRYQNGLTSTTEYFSESIDRLCARYLNSTPIAEKKKKSLLLPVAVVAAVAVLGVGGFLALRGGGRDAAPAAEVTAEPAVQITEAPAEEVTAAPAAEVTAEVTAEPAAEVTTEPAAQVVKGTDFPALSRSIDALIENDDDAGDRAQEVRQNSPVLNHPTLLRKDVASIAFLPSLEGAPEDAWDVSEAGDGRVLAWIVPNGDLYDLTIAGDGGVKIVDSDLPGRLFTGYCNAGSIAFNGCVDLSERTDFFRAFCDCSSLRQLDLTGVCTESAANMACMFEGCAALEALDVSGFDTAKVVDMSHMFWECGSLEALDVSGFDTGMATGMQGMFYHCRRLGALDVSGFDTRRVTDMGYMFDNCEGLASLDVSGFDTGRVADMVDMFNNCAALSALDVSGFDTARVTNMHGMFYNCGALSALDVSGFDTGRVTDMSWMFSGCVGLKALEVGGFNTANVENTSAMFWDCVALDGLDVSGWDTGRVSDMRHMFEGCNLLYRLDMAHWNTANVAHMSEMFAACNYAVELLTTDWDLSAVEDMDSMFQDDAALETIGRDPASFALDGAVNVFEGCAKLFPEQE